MGTLQTVFLAIIIVFLISAAVALMFGVARLIWGRSAKVPFRLLALFLCLSGVIMLCMSVATSLT